MTTPAQGGSVYRGAVAAVALQWSLRLVGLVSVAVLARLLSPADFGLVGLAVAALAFVELLGAVGLRQALLRLDSPERDDLDTAWTIQLILFSGMGAIALAAAPAVGALYGRPELTAIVAVLSLRFVLLGLVNIGIVGFDRELRFGRDVAMRLSSRLLALAVTVAAAVALRSHWALVVGLVCQSGFLAASSWIAHPYRPRLSLVRRRELLGVSTWMFVHTLAQTVQQQVERLALGRFAGVHVVGLFSVSKDLSEMFTQEIATALNRVTFVTVAQGRRPLRGDQPRVASILGAYAMIAAPMGFGLAATAEPAVRVLLGPQWSAAAPLLQIVAVYSAFYAVYKAIASALQASGEARTVALMSGAAAGLLVAAVAAAAMARPDAIAVAWAAFAANLVILVAGTVAMARLARVGLAALVGAVARPFAAAAAMYALLRMIAPSSGSPLVDLAAAVTAGAAVYAVAVLALWVGAGRPRGAEAQAIALVAAGWRRVSAPSAAGPKRQVPGS